jgi:hypothetical protein
MAETASTIPSVGDDDLKALIAAGAIPASAAMPSVMTPRSTMSPLQRNNMAADLAVSGRNAVAPVVASAGIPAVGAAPEISAAPGTSALAGGIPSIAAPTKQAAQAAGRREYAEGLPQVTAAPFTKEYEQQERALSDFKAAHPLGSDISARPGLLGKIEHGLARVGNIAGDIIAPGTMALIPGTDLNTRAQRAGQERGFTAASEAGLREAQAENLESETAQRNAPGWKPLGEPKQDPTTGNWFQAGQEKDTSGNVVTSWKPLAGGPTGGDETKQPVGQDYATQFGQQLGTLTAGMSPADQQKFAQAYAIKPTDTGAVAEKRLADAKAAAALTGEERDRKVREDATAAQEAETNRLKEEELKLKEAGGATGGTEVVRGYDYDANGVPHPQLTSQADAKARGLTNITKATDKDIDTARTHNVVLNDMQVKLNDVVKSAGALNQNEAQRTIIAKALSDEKNTTWQSLLTSGLLSQASQPTKDYIQSVLSLRESAMGLPKEITGGSRVSEIQSSALWATLPGAASLDRNYALSQAKKFQANIDRLWQRVDSVQGMSHEEPAEEVAPEKKPAAAAGAEKPKKIQSFAEFQQSKGGG